MNSNPYVTKYTGPEVDRALRGSLGSIYGDEIKPGTRLVGEFVENPIDLNELKTPGQYTAYFYLKGPKQLAKMNGNTPITISVFKNSNPDEALTTGNEQAVSLWQTIIALSYATEANPAAGIKVGSVIVNFFYRDLNRDDIDSEGSTTEGYGWLSSLMTSGSTTIINNLSSRNTTAALSANMGRYLKYLIDNDDDGVTNLLPCSTPAVTKYNTSDFFANYWSFADSNDNEIVPEYNINRDTFHNISGSFDPVEYYKSLATEDYVQLTADKTQSSSVEYMVKLKPESFIKIIPTDKSFTVSALVRAKKISVPITAWIQIQLYDKRSDDASAALTRVIEVNYKEETADSETTTEQLSQKYYPAVRGVQAISTNAEAGTQTMPWQRVSVTINGVDFFYSGKVDKNTTLDQVARYVGISFGFKFTNAIDGNVPDDVIQFAHIKLERGKVATDSALTFAEMWHEFNNANYLNAIPISKTVNPTSAGNLRDGQGIIYSANNGSWVNRYITSGGGGGFIAQAYPPDMYLNSENTLIEYDSNNLADRRQLLWYVFGTGETGKCEITYVENETTHTYECYEGAFYFYDVGAKKWMPCESNYHVGDVPPANKAKLWLDTGSLRSNYDASYGPEEPADLTYYDPNYSEWRVVGAEPKPSFIVSDTEPTGADADLMWITTKGVASVPYWKEVAGQKVKTWLPIQAIWGHNSDS